MAKVRNIGRQPMGFYDETGKNVVVGPGGEAEIPMSDGYYAKLESILEKCGDRKPYELSGGGGAKPKPESKPAKEAKKEEPKKD